MSAKELNFLGSQERSWNWCLASTGNAEFTLAGLQSSYHKRPGAAKVRLQEAVSVLFYVYLCSQKTRSVFT